MRSLARHGLGATPCLPSGLLHFPRPQHKHNHPHGNHLDEPKDIPFTASLTRGWVTTLDGAFLGVDRLPIHSRYFRRRHIAVARLEH